MALNMNYSADILYNVRTVLENIKARGGLTPGKFLEAELTRLRGERAADTLNIACAAIGRSLPLVGQATEAQMAVLVERAKQQNVELLREIATLRAAKGK